MSEQNLVAIFARFSSGFGNDGQALQSFAIANKDGA
jgi:hypothetical protein